MPSENLINFGGRFEYLLTIQEHWSEVLRALHRHTFPAYQTWFERNEKTVAAEPLSRLFTALQHGAAPEFQEVDIALREWADAHDIRDTWIWDAAVQSMHAWAHGGPVTNWTYLADQLDNPILQPWFGCWIPPLQRWPEFKRCTDAIYRRRLAQYRAHVRKLWGQDRARLGQHALWTVLWQHGKSPEAIRNRHFKNTGKRVSLANIQMRVHDFAGSIGLTLREPKAGSSAKKI